jgi:branched-chain amino acid transport system ATP-binding protein
MTASPGSDPALETIDVTVRYPGSYANDSISLRALAGQIVGLIGPNGAGKTTFVDAVTGFVASTGSVRVAGRRLDGMAPHRRARAGISRTWQTLELFPDLTIRENAQVAVSRLGWRTLLEGIFTPGRRHDASQVDGVLERLGLAAVGDRSPNQVSLGLRKLVGLARALAPGPTVVLLDEPAAGLDEGESAELGATLRQVADDGVALVLIDHDMDLVLDLCDHVYALDMGRLIAEGTPDELRRDPLVVAAYLGDEADRADHAESTVR